jgi:hypothetical protein
VFLCNRCPEHTLGELVGERSESEAKRIADEYMAVLQSKEALCEWRYSCEVKCHVCRGRFQISLEHFDRAQCIANLNEDPKAFLVIIEE